MRQPARPRALRIACPPEGAPEAQFAAGAAAIDVTRVPGGQMHAFVLCTHATWWLARAPEAV